MWRGRPPYPGAVDHPTWEPPECHPTIDSTNLEAARDPRPGRVIVADHQSAGLGRRGRSWTAPPDTSIALTVVLPAPAPGVIGWVPLVAGLAVAQALAESRYAVPAVLKWPNDVLVQEDQEWRKVCGVLAQSVPGAPKSVSGGADGRSAAAAAAAGAGSAGAATGVVVVGAGLNVDQTRDQLPGPTATSWRLARAGGAPLPDGAREQFVTAYLDRLADLVATLVSDPRTVRTAYREACRTLGQEVAVHLPGGGVRTGTAVAVDDSGALVVEGAGARTVHVAGDVVHVRPASSRAPSAPITLRP